MFRCLVLGDSEVSIPFIVNGGLDHVSQDFELSRWSKLINIGIDQADLEVDIVVSASIDFDSIIPTSDGIIYFLNPNNVQEFELFEMLSQIIIEARREIPIIVIFHNKDGFIKLPSNYLIEYIWEHYPFEAFVFDKYSKNKFYEVLECLSEAMITGNVPIDIESAWMRTPFFVNKINRLVLQEDWNNAAKTAEVYTLIKKKFSIQDYFITAEQASWLYYKSKNYLKASKLLEGVSNYDSNKFRKFYVQDMIKNADELVKVKRFRNAAEKYEQAAIWSSLELNDPELSKIALNNAVLVWTSACEFQNSFKLLEKLDHNEQLEMMKKLAPSIALAADYLIKNEKYELIKGQLYYCIDKFQRTGLFSEVKLLGNKISNVLIILLDGYIKDCEPDSANLTLDELTNIWDTFEIEKISLDSRLRKICAQFLEKAEFSALDKLTPMIESIEIQREVSEWRSNSEEDYEKSKKDGVIADYNQAINILENYIKEEVKQFAEDNLNLVNYCESLIKDGQNWDASLILRSRAEWFKKIGHINFSNNLLIKTLNIYLEIGKLVPFIQEIINLSSEKRSEYLEGNIGRLINSVESGFGKEDSIEKINNILENLVRIYRNHLLYDQSKELIKIQIQFIIKKATEHLFENKGLDVIPAVLASVKQGEMLYGSLSEKEHINVDEILEEITKRYIEDGNLSKATEINEKIKDNEINTALHKIILKLEEKRSGDKIKTVQKALDTKIKSEELSILKKTARDILMNQQAILKKRIALKRMVYGKILAALNNNDYELAIKLYTNSTVKMVQRRKLETAGISLAVLGLIMIKLGRTNKIKDSIIEIDAQIGMSAKVFHELFPVKVLDYAIAMYESNNHQKALDAISLLENLPLFEEEKNILFEILGKDISAFASGTETTSKTVSGTVSTSETNTNKSSGTDFTSKGATLVDGPNKSLIQNLIKKLELRKTLFTKRKMMKRKYWKVALDYLGSQSYEEAALEYFNQAKFLVQNKHDDYVPIALVMGIISLIKINQFKDAHHKLEKAALNFGTPQDVIIKLPENQLLEKLIDSMENKNPSISGMIIEGFISELPLFDVEKSMIISLTGKEAGTRITDNQNKEKIQKNQSTVLLNQQIANLQQSLRDIKSTQEKMLKKRTAMRRIYYKSILENLDKKDLINAANQYNSVALRISQRNDYDMAGILILMGAVCLMNPSTNTPIEEIKGYIDDILNTLGFTKKVINETFGLKLANFLLESKKIENVNLFNQGWQMLIYLPLFDQEKELIK